MYLEAFRLRVVDVLITKDSCSEDLDIGVPAYVVAPRACIWHLRISHLAMLRPDRTSVHPRFLFWAMASSSVSHQLSVAATGLTRYGLRQDSIASAAIPYQPLLVQRAIADFLGRETARIDELVDKKIRLTSLLEEKRTALITHAVTKGLDPSAITVGSGIPGVGRIPNHWGCVALRYVCEAIRDGTHLPPPRVEKGIPLLSVRNIVDRKFVLRDDDSYISEDDFVHLRRSFDFREGDVLLAIVGTLGKTAIVPPMAPFSLQRSVAAFRANDRSLGGPYLHRWFESKVFQQLLWRHIGFSAQPGIYLGTLAGFKMPVPPMDEQLEIVQTLSVAVESMDDTVRLLDTQLGKLAEYRQALITSAVTGQLDVATSQTRPEEAIA